MVTPHYLKQLKQNKMKHVRVNSSQIALVFKNGAYQKMLKEGSYWLWENVEVIKYDITHPFIPPVELNILLQDRNLVEALNVVEVKNHQIAIQYKNGLLDKVLTAGRYAFWKGPVVYDFVIADISKAEITEPVDRATLASGTLDYYVRSYTVEGYEKAVLYIDGNYVKQLESGVYYWWKNSMSIQVKKVDIRLQQLEINGQEILTRDKASLRINAWAQFKVVDIEKALLENKEYDRQLYIIFQLALREYVAGYSFDELLEKKEAIGPFVMQKVKDAVEELGVQVQGFGIRDIVLPGDVKEIMNQVLVAEKRAQANIIMRREETASTRSLLNTAKLMEDNQMLWKLKEMEYVEKIADKISGISLSGNGKLVEQLKDIFTPK